MHKISAILNTYNEEKNIKRALESIKWADEIVVVDMYSTDKTTEIARNYTNNIFQYPKIDYVEPARNFAISKATGDWILILDADEEIPPQLSKKLREIAKNNLADYVKLPRKNIIFGKWIEHTGWWPDYLIRFFKKGKVSWKKNIHSIPKASGRELLLDQVQYAIIHYNYDSISQFIHRNLEIYAKEEAKEKLKNRYVFDYKDAIRFPLEEFLRRYFVWKGYKDGLHGLSLSLLMAFYHFIIFCYIWEQNGFTQYNKSDFLLDTEKEFKKAGKEGLYWISKEKSGLLKNSIKINFNKIWQKIKSW